MESPAVAQFKFQLSGEVTRQKISKTNDFQQAKAKYISLSKTDQEHLIDKPNRRPYTHSKTDIKLNGLRKEKIDNNSLGSRDNAIVFFFVFYR